MIQHNLRFQGYNILGAISPRSSCRMISGSNESQDLRFEPISLSIKQEK
jgi:hypothetical protein